MSWVAAVDTESKNVFYGYTGPGFTEEFWILDVDRTRLMIAAERSLDSPPRTWRSCARSSTPSASSPDVEFAARRPDARRRRAPHKARSGSAASTQLTTPESPRTTARGTSR